MRAATPPAALAVTALGLLAAAAGCPGPERDVGVMEDELRMQGDGTLFTPERVEGLPEPARRYLLAAIAPGTPLARSVEFRMSGSILLDPERDPLAMEADQVLSPPDGFVWRARARGGMMRISGFDRYARGAGEMRWKLFGVIPVMRASGSDVTRSAAGRLAMEAVLLPAALVPGTPAADAAGLRWEPLDELRARFHFTVGDETVSTTLEVDPDGRPLRAHAMRWQVPPGEEAGRYQRFDVLLSGTFRSGGYTIPSSIVAGWNLGSEDEFRFFEATLEEADFR